MPEMNGFELFDRLRNLDKNVKVLFTTALGFSYEVLTGLYPLQNDNDSSDI
jgi:CheY-like chemotaxis protein